MVIGLIIVFVGFVGVLMAWSITAVNKTFTSPFPARWLDGFGLPVIDARIVYAVPNDLSWGYVHDDQRYRLRSIAESAREQEDRVIYEAIETERKVVALLAGEPLTDPATRAWPTAAHMAAEIQGDGPPPPKFVKILT